MTIDNCTLVTICTMIVGLVGLSIRYCLKSKCENVDCCFGVFHIDRRPELESNSIESN